MSDREQAHEIFRSFREVNQAFHQAIWKETEDLGMTPIQFLVLKTLCRNPGSSLRELADLLYIGTSAASGIVDRLVKMGAIIRERSESDRRSIRLILSPAGKELLCQADALSLERVAPLLELPDNDVAELLRIHQTIVQKLTDSGERQKK